LRYRAIQTSFWQDPEYEDWDFLEKSFYLYLITSPYTLMSGFLRLSLKHISVDTGLSVDQIKKLLSHLEQRKKIRRAGNFVWIKKFLKYQNLSGSKIYTNIVNELHEILNHDTVPLIREMIIAYPEIKETPNFEKLQHKLEVFNQDPPSDVRNTPSMGYRTETETETETDKYIECSSYEEHLSSQGDDVNDVKIDRVPYTQIVEIYHQECPDLPKVKVMNKTRKRLLRARWKEHPDLEFWKKYFKKVQQSDFLCGRVEPRKGRAPFIADFEWLIRPNNFAKVLEGRYDNRKTKSDVEAILQEFDIKGGE